VADADEVFWEDVQQEAPDELVDGEFEDLPTVAVGVVAVVEGDAMLIGAQDSPVRERNAMGIAAEIAQHALGSCEGRLGIDDPVLPSKRVEESGQRLIGSELASIEALSQAVEELAPKDLRESPHGEQEARVSRRDPARAIAGQRAPRHDAMQVGMEREGLAPGVEDGGDADLAAEVLRIAADWAREAT
jgi:hypothetical protein